MAQQRYQVALANYNAAVVAAQAKPGYSPILLARAKAALDQASAQLMAANTASIQNTDPSAFPSPASTPASKGRTVPIYVGGAQTPVNRNIAALIAASAAN